MLLDAAEELRMEWGPPCPPQAESSPGTKGRRGEESPWLVGGGGGGGESLFGGGWER